MEVSRLGIKLELQLQAYATGTATLDLSLICNLHCILWQCWILNPLSKAGGWTHILMDTILDSCFFFFFKCVMVYGVPRLGIRSELHSRPEPKLWQCRILNPLFQAGDRTCVPALPWHYKYCYVTAGTPYVRFLTFQATVGTPAFFLFSLFHTSQLVKVRWWRRSAEKHLQVVSFSLSHYFFSMATPTIYGSSWARIEPTQQLWQHQIL